MNPLTKVKLINELNQREADLGVKDTVSWHSAYKDSAWIFIGGFPYELTEGDIICVFSQYGEIANINLVRDKKTGKSKGFCFICYEDQRSTILAVDNFNGIKIKGRTIRVDHVSNYRPPKDNEDIDDVTKRLREEGCAPKAPEPSSSESEEEEEEYAVTVKKPKKDKKEKKRKKKEKKEKRRAEKEERQRESQALAPPAGPVRVKQEREDAGYAKYTQRGAPEERLAQGERPDGPELRDPRDRQEEEAGLRPHRGERERLRAGEEERWREGAGESKNGGGGPGQSTARDDRKNTERERPRERERNNNDRERERTRERERDWDSERNREKDSERNREKEREKDSERNRERDRDKGQERCRDRSRERDRDWSRERDGERERYSKHREGEHRRR